MRSWMRPRSMASPYYPLWVSGPIGTTAAKRKPGMPGTKIRSTPNAAARDTPMKFYGHFAAAYGTIWLLLLGLSLITRSHIDAGAFGLCGFPVIALVYVLIRMGTDQ